jgi:hypothetical protein
VSREVVRMIREGRMGEAAAAQGRRGTRFPRERELRRRIEELEGKLRRAGEALDAAWLVMKMSYPGLVSRVEEGADVMPWVDDDDLPV